MAINVMVNGLSKEKGKMAKEVAQKVIENSNLELVPFSLTGPDVTEEVLTEGIFEKNPVFLLTPEKREDKIKDVAKTYKPFISVDYTHPNVVNDNADFYCRHNLPFVMGTTGGDREALEQRVKDSNIVAVIAPNMAKQIVALQEFMEDFASRHISMRGYKLKIRESHQQGKADTSGTAKAMIKYFNEMGIEFEKDQIEMIRNPEEQRKLGVPEEFLDAHGWHSYFISNPSGGDMTGIYKLARGLHNEFFYENPVFDDYDIQIDSDSCITAISPDKNVLFYINTKEGDKIEITHNVNGRSIYAKGTLDAIRYLQEKIDERKGHKYDMIDVLKGN